MPRYSPYPHRRLADPVDHEERYEASDAFVVDAIDWCVGARDLPAHVVDVICAAYRESATYANVVEDLRAGLR